jgi:organic hydroperoxide reductase OsmC/OhrA
LTLETEADVPGLDKTEFQRTAEEAAKGCIFTRALGGVEEIKLAATLR